MSSKQSNLQGAVKHNKLLFDHFLRVELLIFTIFHMEHFLNNCLVSKFYCRFHPAANLLDTVLTNKLLTVMESPEFLLTTLKSLLTGLVQNSCFSRGRLFVRLPSQFPTRITSSPTVTDTAHVQRRLGPQSLTKTLA